jgi:hypothetical protein
MTPNLDDDANIQLDVVMDAYPHANPHGDRYKHTDGKSDGLDDYTPTQTLSRLPFTMTSTPGGAIPTGNATSRRRKFRRPR